MRKSHILAVTLVFTLAFAGAASASDVTIASGLVTWKAQDEESVLRISDPDGSVRDLTFGPGETPTFGLFDKAGNVIKDGQYNWELMVNVAAPEAVSKKIGALRAKGFDREAAELMPAPAKSLSGSFKVWNGDFVIPTAVESTEKDIVHNDDVIITGSLCVGFDCVNGENFGFDTVRLKENNLRIKFQDTSTGTFPTTDWQLTANDSASGGANKFSIDDVDAGRTPFTIEASAPSNSLYVEDDGDVGFGTSTPVVDLHVVTGNTPTLRLEQNGSSGFTPQTWDLAGNETNFFIRDVTNGSRLPFRIRPSAPTSSIDIASDGDVGIGTASPADRLHVENTSGNDTDDFVVTSAGRVGIGTTAPTTLLEIEAVADNGGRMRFEETATGDDWEIGGGAGNSFVILDPADGAEFILNSAGNLTIAGALFTSGPTCSGAGGCDGVFASDFEVESIEEHAAQMWELGYLPAVGPTLPKAPMNLTEKAGNMLNELEKAHVYIEQLHNTIKELSTRLEKLEGAKVE